MINQFLERIRSHIIIEEAELTDAENEGVKGVIIEAKFAVASGERH